MALSESALSDLLAALTVGEGTDLVREWPSSCCRS